MAQIKQPYQDFLIISFFQDVIFTSFNYINNLSFKKIYTLNQTNNAIKFYKGKKHWASDNTKAKQAMIKHVNLGNYINKFLKKYL